MIRLALVLALFVTLAVAGVAQADPGPSAEASVEEAVPAVPAEKGPERLDEPRPEPRWVPRQARKREEFGPAVTPYPVLFGPAGIPSLPF